MNRIKIKFPSEKSENEIEIEGIPLTDIIGFLREADNGSFEQLVIKYDPLENLLIFASETGVKFPEYGHFMTKIADSKYSKVFSFTKVS